MNMNSPSFLILSLMSLALLLHGAAGSDPLYTGCSSSGNYTPGDSFSHNLRSLLDSLSVAAPPTGFSLGISGGENAPDRVYGLAMCRGDVESAACRACVIEARKQIRQSCPNQRGAFAWFDYCLLRYSDEEFFGVVDQGGRLYMWNVQNVTDPAAFNGKVAGLMGNLAVEAHHLPQLFATGKAEAGDDGKLYGLVQCTRDLSAGDCFKCLESAVGGLPTCCGGKRGGRVIVGASCIIRYELYPFFTG